MKTQDEIKANFFSHRCNKQTTSSQCQRQLTRCSAPSEPLVTSHVYRGVLKERMRIKTLRRGSNISCRRTSQLLQNGNLVSYF